MKEVRVNEALLASIKGYEENLMFLLSPFNPKGL